MKRVMAWCIAGLSLGGCVSQNMDAGLLGLVGQDIHVAIARLGYPNSQRTVAGDTVYTWSVNQTDTLPMTTGNSAFVTIGGAPASGLTTSTTYLPVNYNCTIDLGASANGVVKNYHWTGNIGGCSHYADALKAN